MILTIKKQMVLFVCFLMLPTMSIAAERCTAESVVCNIGIFPHVGARHIRETYSVLAEDLSFEFDMPTRLLSADTFIAFRKEIFEEKFDIALIGPGMYAQMLNDINYLPLVRPKATIQFAMYVLESSDIETMQDLREKTFGRADDPTGTWLASKSLLMKDKVYDKVGKFVKTSSAESCAYALASGRVDACVTPKSLLDIIQKQIPIKFKVIATSEDLPSSVYVAHKSLSDEKKQILTDYLLQRSKFTHALKSDYFVYLKMEK